MMKLETAEKLIAAKKAEWDGWDILVYEHKDGFYHTSGIFRNGKWLRHTRVAVDHALVCPS